MKKIVLLLVAIFFCGLSYSQTPYPCKSIEKHSTYTMKGPRNVYNLTKSLIAESMAQWQTRGEFERKVDFDKRILNNSKRAFDSIVVAQMIKILMNETDWYCYPLQYDVDSELFKIEFINEDVTLSYAMDVKMDIAFAKKLRMFTDEFDKMHPEWSYTSIQEYVAVNLVADWRDVLMLDGHFLFKRIVMRLRDKSKFTFDGFLRFCR